MRKLVISTILLFGLSVPAYAGQQERAMVTGAATGAAIGAAVGSNSGETVKGAIVGAFFGTIAGAILSDMNDSQPQTVSVVHDHRPVVHTPVYNGHRPVTRHPLPARRDHREDRYRSHRERVSYDRHMRPHTRYEMARMDRRQMHRALPERRQQRKFERHHERY